MDEPIHRLDTAFFGPWRALGAAIGEHCQRLGLIQLESGHAYTRLAGRQCQMVHPLMGQTPDLATRRDGHASAAEAIRERLAADTRRVLAAQGDLLSTTAALAGDSLASMQSVAEETAAEVGLPSTTA